jgi:hypothetical protein
MEQGAARKVCAAISSALFHIDNGIGRDTEKAGAVCIGLGEAGGFHLCEPSQESIRRHIESLYGFDKLEYTSWLYFIQVEWIEISMRRSRKAERGKYGKLRTLGWRS